MADAILGNPWISQNQLAAVFGRTPGWISLVITSDAFQAYLASRKEELVDPALRASIEENFRSLVLRSAEVLREKLTLPTNQVSDNLALGVLTAASKALGYGARVEVNANINHTHSLVGVLSSLAPARAEREINPIDLPLSEAMSAT